jgi:glycosyltransferase involved in cell wall biosynthesis
VNGAAPRAPRLVFVIASLRRGGAERQVVALSEAMRARGWDLWILCLNTAGNPEWVDRVRRAGVRIEELDIGRPRDERSFGWDLLRLIHAFRFLRKVRPDVIYCFMWWSYALFVPIAKAARIPVVAACRQSLSTIERGKPWLRPLHLVVDRLADVVVCVSEAAKVDAIRNVRTPERKVVVIPNGVRVPASYGAPPNGGRVRVVCIANLHPYKGHTVLLDAFARATARVGCDRLRLELIGSGIEEPRLVEQTRRLGLAGCVEFLGTLEDVESRIRASAFTVLPSTSEGLPLSVMESMALARPVVATRVGGVPELLGDGGGVMVPPADAEALSEAIVELATDADRRSRLGEQARAIAERRFSIEAIADRTLSVFRRIAASKGVALPIGAGEHRTADPD